MPLIEGNTIAPGSKRCGIEWSGAPCVIRDNFVHCGRPIDGLRLACWRLKQLLKRVPRWPA